MLSRRRFLKAATVAALASGTGFANGLAAAANRKCPPFISGTLWFVSGHESSSWQTAQWRRELTHQKAIGFDLLWLVNAQALLNTQEFSLRQLLDLCSEMGFKAIIDTGSTHDWHSRLNVKEEIAACTKNIRAINERVAGHSAFHSWYIPHEIYMCWGPMNDYIRELYPALVTTCKKAANRPVSVSPFFILDRTKVFGDFRFNEPAEYRAYWADLIKRSGLNIVMLQDSGEHFAYVTIEQRRPFFDAMSRACKDSGAQLWGNVEVAEMNIPSIEEYVKRYGRVHHATVKDMPWRAVPMDRLKQKLDLAASYSGRLISWGYKEYCRPALGPAAKDWYRNYLQYRTAND